MKTLNFLSRAAVIGSAFGLLCGCDNRPDRTLSPPEDARWVTVTFRVPEGIALQPAELLYRSAQCKSVRYNSSNEPHDIPGYNDIKRLFSAQENSNIRHLRVAVDGGGQCHWQLNSLRVSFRIAGDNPLVKGKEVIDTSYIFDFGDYGLSDGYGTGRAKAFSGERLDLKTDFFPMSYISHMFNKTTLKLFGGDTDSGRWSRRYQLKDTRFITIEPIIHMEKNVSLEADKQRGFGMVITYPDGDEEHIRKVNPDYDKLLSINNQSMH
ncbi:hypothetical protein PMPD1_2244 [Paramixta manurensis]|uniref:Lipoprotein n=1 Tax=Paramixta manurensis TaxID=2740817 RepID=A0A6M8UBW1_9GAMM|nr:hypothetical protein PMPD1_2244 [Erwiniaceae bacterium PD-1]